MASIACFLHSSLNASALIFAQYRPAAFACLVNSAVLYQPALARRWRAESPGRSKNTPTVAAPQPKAAVILLARP